MIAIPRNVLQFFRFGEPLRPISGKFEMLGSVTIKVPERYVEVMSPDKEEEPDLPVRIGSFVYAAEFPRSDNGDYYLCAMVGRTVASGKLYLKFPEHRIPAGKHNDERYVPKWYIRSNERRKEILAWVQEILDRD